MFRLLFIAILIYLGYKLVQNIFTPDSPGNSRVKGEPRDSKPLDLSDRDIEDAKYRDINDGR